MFNIQNPGYPTISSLNRLCIPLTADRAADLFRNDDSPMSIVKINYNLR